MFALSVVLNVRDMGSFASALLLSMFWTSAVCDMVLLQGTPIGDMVAGQEGNPSCLRGSAKRGCGMVNLV